MGEACELAQGLHALLFFASRNFYRGLYETPVMEGTEMETKLLLAATTGIAIFCYNLAKKSYLKGFDAGYDTGKDRALKSDMTDEEFIKYRLSLLS